MRGTAVLLVCIAASSFPASAEKLTEPTWVLFEVDVHEPVAWLWVGIHYSESARTYTQTFDVETQRAYFPQALTGAGGEPLNAGALDQEARVRAVRLAGSGGGGERYAAVGVYRTILVLSEGIDRWTVEVDGNATVQEIARGPAYSLQPRDFTFGADAQVLAAEAMVADGTASLSIEHELIGVALYGDIVYDVGRIYVPQEHMPYHLRLSGPSGTSECPCVFRDWRQHPAPVYGPGEYVFTLQGAGVRAAAGPMVLVADVPLFE